MNTPSETIHAINKQSDWKRSGAEAPGTCLALRISRGINTWRIASDPGVPSQLFGRKSNRSGLNSITGPVKARNVPGTGPVDLQLRYQSVTVALTAAAGHSAREARYGEVDTITRGPRAVNLNVYGRATRRPGNDSLFAGPDFLGIHLERSLFINCPGQFGDVFPLIPCDKSHQAVVLAHGNVPI
jgi:hypothetical protein